MQRLKRESWCISVAHLSDITTVKFPALTIICSKHVNFLELIQRLNTIRQSLNNSHEQKPPGIFLFVKDIIRHKNRISRSL